ncbi:MAG: hypothetical protein ABIP90_08970 [Vicinamibacterales bacterium]
MLTQIAPHCVHPGAGPAALEIIPVESDPRDADDFGSPALSVPMRHPDGEGQYEVWRRGETLVLRVGPIAVFSCMPGRLEYQCLREVPDEALQWQTFGLVISAWSEWAGRPVLHAATVDVSGSAVGFLGRSGAGKSSLTLEFLRNGHRIFGDDHLILEHSSLGLTALPAIPWLKLGLDLAARSGFDPVLLPRIHSASEKRRLDVREGEWAGGPLPVGPIYLVERGWQQPEVVIERMAPSASVLELIRHSYVPKTVAAAGLAAQRLPSLTAAVQQGGVWRLRYPDGVEWLPKVRQAVARHVAERANDSPVQSPR